MTPYELNIHIEAFMERQRMQGEESLTQAYLTAYWQRVKRMPELKKLLNDSRPKKQIKQTPEQIFAQVKQLNALFSGEAR